MRFYLVMWLVACSSTSCGHRLGTPLPSAPARATFPTPPEPLALRLPRTPAPPLPAGMSWVVPPVSELAIERVVEDGGDVLAVEGGRVLRLSHGAWVPTRRAAPASGDSARIRADGSVERLSDGRVFSSPGFRPTRAWLDAGGNPVVTGQAIRWWRDQRTSLVERDTPEAHGWFSEPGGPGWQAVDGAVPREVVGLIARDPPLLVGRAGEVSSVQPGDGDRDYAEAVVDLPRPRALRLVPLRDGALLRITEAGLSRVDPAGVTELPIDDEVLAGLHLESAQPAHASPTMAVALDDGSAIIALRSRDARAAPVYLAVRVHGLRVERLPALPVEPVALTAAERSTAVLLAYAGVFRLEGERLTSLPTEGFELQHPYGAFRGADGRVRVLGAASSAGCVDGTRVVSCSGPALDDRRVHVLDDGLVVEDQRIDTWLVRDAGTAQLDPAPFPGVMYVHYAGRSDDLLVLADREIGFRTGDGWSRVALPEGWKAQTVARAPDGRALLGLEGGAILSVSRP